MRKIGCPKTIVHETLSQPIINDEAVNMVTASDDTSDWRTPIVVVLESKKEDNARLRPKEEERLTTMPR